jgi:hypothetical protein
MKTRKQKETERVNILSEERYLKTKFLSEQEESDIPEFQVTPEGIGKSKIKFIWKSKGVKLPQDVRDNPLFEKPEFDPLKKIYVDKTEAAKVVSDFINSKQYLFK